MAAVKNFAISTYKCGMGNATGSAETGQLQATDTLETAHYEGESCVVLFGVGFAGFGSLIKAEQDDFATCGLDFRVHSYHFGHDGAAGRTPGGRAEVDIELGISSGTGFRQVLGGRSTQRGDHGTGGRGFLGREQGTAGE